MLFYVFMVPYTAWDAGSSLAGMADFAAASAITVNTVPKRLRFG